MSIANRSPVIDPASALGFLAQASGVLARSLDYERTLEDVARLVVPDVADWCAVDVVEPDGSLRQITSAHPDAEQEALLMELRRRYREQKGGTAGAAYAILSGDPILASDVRDAAEIEIEEDELEVYSRLGPRSYMIVPLTARGRTIGALTLLSTREGRHYVEADLDFAQHLGRRFALAIDNARLYDEAERALAMLDTLFHAVPVGLAFLDTDLRCVRANEALNALTGSTGCDGRALPDLLGGLDGRLEGLARDVLATGEPLLNHELEIDGAHWLLSLTPVRAADGGPRGLGLVMIDVTERRALLDRERDAARRSRFLAEAGAALETSLEYETTLRNVAHIAVPELADSCAVHVVAEKDEIELVATADTEPARERAAWERERSAPLTGDEGSGPSAVIRSGSTEATPTSVSAPLRARGRTFGAITLAIAGDDRTFTPADVELVEELARRAALAVENARLYTERTRIAHTLQAELLPSRLPAIAGASVAVRYRAAGELNEVGGDFYDVFHRGDGAWGLMIGDVSGKGAEAAAVTALARHTVRTASRHVASPAELLATLNEALMVQREGSEFCTVCVGRLARTGSGASLRLALGGHMPALVLRADGGVEAHGVPGTLLGIFPDPELTDVDVELAPGDLLLLYTDGVTEAGPAGDEIGEEGLEELLAGCAGCAADEVVARVEQAAVDKQDGQPRDDIALVAVRIEE